jgi:two-component system phosphate regulon response regulator PhoB
MDCACDGREVFSKQGGIMKDVLVVEDNPEMRILVEAALTDMQIGFATTLSDSRIRLRRKKYDLMILDLGLPDGDGFQLLTELSTDPSLKDMPVIVLSGKTETSTKVIAFSIGAEDFVSKPFDPLELKARVAAKLKKAERLSDKHQSLHVGDLQIDVHKQKVMINSGPSQITVDLTSLEFRLLLTMARAPERVFSRDHLLNEVWGENLSVTDRTVDTHIGHLRKKLAPSASRIDTVIGSGYRFLAEPAK